MPEIDYGKENTKVSKVNYDYPKLSGLKKDEKARILLIEKNPVYEWVHELKRPKIVDGAPVMETAKRKDNSEYQKHTMDFLSRPICTGDAGVLEEDGIDPKGCLMCALAHRNPDAAAPPARRFATHVLRYATKGGTHNILQPFQVELLVWSFTERVFAQISDFKEEWGDLRAHDLLIECKNQQFQNYEINVAAKAEFMEDEERRELVKRVYAEQRIADLSIACGRQTEERWIRSDVEKIEEAWAQVAAYNGKSAPARSMREDLDAIAGEERWADGKTEQEAAAEKPRSAPESSTQATDDLDGLFDGIADGPKEPISDEPAAEPDEAPAKSSKPASSAVEDDLDALLGA